MLTLYQPFHDTYLYQRCDVPQHLLSFLDIFLHGLSRFDGFFSWIAFGIAGDNGSESPMHSWGVWLMGDTFK
jgi:hypothetical protein